MSEINLKLFFRANEANTAKQTNIRRENKLYSYAEQMAELELIKVNMRFN